jgi:hypothetical protein
MFLRTWLQLRDRALGHRPPGGHIFEGDRYRDQRHTAWTRVTLRERARRAGRPDKRKDETSRDIGIASLPLRACRPSGGFVLGTLSAPAGRVKRFCQIHFPPNVDNCVETMCTVGCCFVDQKSRSDHCTGEAMWKPVRAVVSSNLSGYISPTLKCLFRLRCLLPASGRSRPATSRVACRLRPLLDG